MNGFTLKNIQASYNDHTVLENFSAVFEKGQIYVLMGPSGCGKTTLLRLLLGLKRPDSGILEGVEQLRCSAVFQEDRLCETLSAIENVALICKHKDRISRHLQTLGIVPQEQYKPVRELSGGQRRRVALVRAILFSSDFIIMDEPFKGLDADTRAKAVAYVLENKGDRGIILVTHDPEEASMFGGERIQMNSLE